MNKFITEEIKNILLAYFKTHFPAYDIRECIFEYFPDYCGGHVECSVLSTSVDVIVIAYQLNDSTLSHDNLSETCSYEEDETDIAWGNIKSWMYDEDVVEVQHIVY